MIVPFEGIHPIWEGSLTGTGATQRQPQGTGEVGLPFADFIQYAVDNLKEKDAVKNETQYLLATGQLDNPAEMGIASTNYQMSLDLVIQLRNKALEAYNELTRISL